MRPSAGCPRGAASGPTRRSWSYGNNQNWFAAWAYRQLQLYGHRGAELLDGGWKLWTARGLPTTTDVPSDPATTHELPEPDFSLRAFRDDILPRLGDVNLSLVDVRSPPEFRGEVVASPGMTETAQRAGPAAFSWPGRGRAGGHAARWQAASGLPVRDPCFAGPEGTACSPVVAAEA